MQPEGEGLAEVMLLRHEEGVRIDPDRLLALYVELGETGAEGVVCRAMEELAVRLAEMDGQYRAGQMDPFCRNARSMERVAAQIGMSTLARVARDLNSSAGAGDTAAFAAIWARMVRIGDRSLLAVWDVRDLSV